MPVGDVGAGTETGDEVSVGVAQKPVAPLDEAFRAGPGEDEGLDGPGERGGFDERQIAGKEPLEHGSVFIADSDRKARLDPVPSEQFVRSPSEEVAAVTIDQKNPSVPVQFEQDDVSRVQVLL